MLNPRVGMSRRGVVVAALATGALALSAPARAEAPAPHAVPGIHPRAAWRAAPALPGGRPHTAVRFGLHHTAGNLVGSAQAPSTLRGIQAFHQHGKGWIDLAYHVFVDADGAAWEGRDPALAGDTATTYDPAGYFLVCALGNFETTVPPAAQVEGIARVLAALSRARGLPLTTLAAHRDLAATLCPGAHLYALVEPIRARAIALAAATTP